MTGRQDDVMGTLHEGMVELTDNIIQYFSWGNMGLVEENVQLGIIQAITSKVVVAGVSKINREIRVKFSLNREILTKLRNSH